MWCRTLKVLMWKHLIGRMRKFISTPIELFSSLLFFMLIFLYKDQLNPVPPPGSQPPNGVQNTEEFTLDKPFPIRLLYSPDTKIAGQIMYAVGKQLNLKRLKSFPNHIVRGYYPYTNETEIAQFEEEIRNNEAIVKFKDMDGPDFPESLNYTIRVRNNFITSSYKSYDELLRPHSEFGRRYEEFMKLQWTIDTTYIKLTSKKNVTQKLTMQEFPFYTTSFNGIIELLSEGMSICCWLSLLFVFVLLMSRLMQERSSGIQELIKMVGVSSNTLTLSHFLNVLPTGLVYSIVGSVILKATSNPIIPNSNGILIFLMLILHFVSVIALAFACSCIVRSTQYVTSMSVLVYVVLWMPSQIIRKYKLSWVQLLFSGFMPHVPMQWFWDELGVLEQYGYTLSFSSMLYSHLDNTGSVVMCYLALLIQIIFFFALALYLTMISPGQYGQALPWNFLFQKQFWSKNEVVPRAEREVEVGVAVEVEEEAPSARDPRYFEKPPARAEVGIRIDNVSKVFPKQRALSNVSLDVYKGEITVLLGHNGAGKTTLMSIITGMISATEGKVYVNGLNAAKNPNMVRKDLGLCPQHNLFFPDLTVLEHVTFFTWLKGSTLPASRAAARVVVQQLGLREASGRTADELSGGMQRRLQLACALAGGASVLVLDEPTAGLDVETRRQLWDLLLSLRGSRTVLLTTHFMEEADALGDRVAALHAGRLRCHATTMYLKKAIGTGYRLSLTTTEPGKEEEITAAVTSHVADASLREQTTSSLAYSLPAAASSTFPQLFADLETRRSELGINSIGVGVSTLEEVFLKLCSDTDNSTNDDESDSSDAEPTYKKLTGCRLFCRQFCVLFKRQWKYLWSKKISFLILQVIVPIIMIIAFTRTFNNDVRPPPSNKPIDMNLDIYNSMKDVKVLYNVMYDEIALKRVMDKLPNVHFENTTDVAEAILAVGKIDVLEYGKYLAGIELNETNAKVLYTSTVRHAAPVALNLLANMLAHGRTITTRNDPINGDFNTYDLGVQMPKEIVKCVMWGIFVVFIILMTYVNFVSLVCTERASGAHRAHCLAAGTAAPRWAAALACHASAALAALLAPTLLVAALFDTDRTFTQPDFLGAVFVFLMMGTLAFFALMYLVSLHFSERGSGIILLGLLIIFGGVTPLLTLASETLTPDEPRTAMYYVMVIAGHMMPPHVMTVSVIRCALAARLNAYCDLNRGKCPALMAPDLDFDTEKCCAHQNPKCYFCTEKYAPGQFLIVLAVQFICYMALTRLAELGVFNGLRDRVLNMRYRAPDKQPADEEVRAETLYVTKQIDLPKGLIQDAMLVDDVHKTYAKVFGKSCHAVQGISFSVQKGECFGLLGVNGAGKSTTFKMLTGEVCATRGRIFANGHYLCADRASYLNSLGYCPQFFGLDGFLTGRENLELMLTLRGYNAADVQTEATNWINIVGLEKYSSRAVSAYSGGCKRRLAAVLALCAGAPVTLLDEPTSGVDVSARRRVWAALRRGLRHQRSVVISSHSMDEMEALCGRIAIVSRGVVCALGAAAALRARHAAGHAVVLKVLPTAPGDEVDSNKSDIDRLKNSIHNKFNCTLKDEHKTMLHYHINDTMRYSELFEALEELKNTYPGLVEDYSVTETTLEEVFLSFAKDEYTDSDFDTPIRSHVV